MKPVATLALVVCALVSACPICRGQTVPSAPAAAPAAPQTAVPELPKKVEEPPTSIQPLPPPTSSQLPQPAATPTTQYTPNVGVPPQPPLAEAGGDCTIHNFQCAERCDPLPSQYPNTAACVQSACSMTEENCIERLVEVLRNGDNSSLTFRIRSEGTASRLSFYSQDRNFLWPGGGRDYIVDSELRSYSLSCQTGEQVCFGAWTRSSSDYWGVGYNNQYNCHNCCRICNGQTVTFTLQGP